MRWLGGDLFVRRLALLAGGTACGQAIVIASGPLLTRIYTAAEFGHLQAFLSVLTLVATVASLRYETAILLPADECDAASAALVAALVAGTVALLTCGAVLLLPVGLMAGGAGWLLPLSVLGAGWNQVATHWCIREGEYRKIARMKVAQGMAQTVVQVGLGIVHSGAIGLLIGNLVGRTAGTGSIVSAAWRSRREAFRRAACWGRLTAIASRYRSFPLVATWATLLNTAVLSVIPLLIGGTYGAESLGLYGLVERSLNVSAILVGQAASQVYMNSAARLAVDDPCELAALFRGTARRLAILGALPCVVVIAFGPWLFAAVFGAAWRDAGTLARIMAVSAYAALVVWPLTPTLSILERQSWQLGWDAARLVIVLTAFAFVRGAGGGLIVAVAANSAVLIVMYAVHALLSYRAIQLRMALPQEMPLQEVPA